MALEYKIVYCIHQVKCKHQIWPTRGCWPPPQLNYPLQHRLALTDCNAHFMVLTCTVYIHSVPYLALLMSTSQWNDGQTLVWLGWARMREGNHHILEGGKHIPTTNPLLWKMKKMVLLMVRDAAAFTIEGNPRAIPTTILGKTMTMHTQCPIFQCI